MGRLRFRAAVGIVSSWQLLAPFEASAGSQNAFATAHEQGPNYDFTRLFVAGCTLMPRAPATCSENEAPQSTRVGVKEHARVRQGNNKASYTPHSNHPPQQRRCLSVVGRTLVLGTCAGLTLLCPAGHPAGIPAHPYGISRGGGDYTAGGAGDTVGGYTGGGSISVFGTPDTGRQKWRSPYKEKDAADGRGGDKQIPKRRHEGAITRNCEHLSALGAPD